MQSLKTKQIFIFLIIILCAASCDATRQIRVSQEPLIHFSTEKTDTKIICSDGKIFGKTGYKPDEPEKYFYYGRLNQSQLREITSALGDNPINYEEIKTGWTRSLGMPTMTGNSCSFKYNLEGKSKNIDFEKCIKHSENLFAIIKREFEKISFYDWFELNELEQKQIKLLDWPEKDFSITEYYEPVLEKKIYFDNLEEYEKNALKNIKNDANYRSKYFQQDNIIFNFPHIYDEFAQIKFLQKINPEQILKNKQKYSAKTNIDKINESIIKMIFEKGRIGRWGSMKYLYVLIPKNNKTYQLASVKIQADYIEPKSAENLCKTYSE